MRRTYKEVKEEMELRHAQMATVKKDNRLIQKIKRRQYEMTVQEQKVLCYILSIINERDREDPDNTDYVYTFNTRHFCKVCGIYYDSGSNYRNVKAALDSIASNAFWLDYGEGEIRFQWIAAPDIKKDSGIIEIEIPKKIMPYLRGLTTNYTSYQLYNILALRSSYSVMLYELFKSWVYSGSFRVEVSALREYLGIKDDKYKEYRSFRRAVLERSVKEIEEVTDLRVSYTGIRIGRFCKEIEFTVTTVEGLEGAEASRRAMAMINGVKYSKNQRHLFEVPEEKEDENIIDAEDPADSHEG
jgi:plasmid replication initiation protein